MTKAAIATAVGAPLEIVDIDVADPKAGEVRIEMGASGVCHSDLSVVNGVLPIALPAILGHEGAGTITQVGEGVGHLARRRPRRRVVGARSAASATCARTTRASCARSAAMASMSGGLLDMTSPRQPRRQPISVMAASGTFAEEAVIPAIGAVKIDSDIPITAGALIGCGVLTGFGAAVNTASIRKGDNVAVIGCGGVGLNVIQGAKHAGAERIIAVDMVDGKLSDRAEVRRHRHREPLHRRRRGRQGDGAHRRPRCRRRVRGHRPRRHDRAGAADDPPRRPGRHRRRAELRHPAHADAGDGPARQREADPRLLVRRRRTSTATCRCSPASTRTGSSCSTS